MSEQPDTPSADVTSSDVATRSEASDQSEQESSSTRSWWSRFLGRGDDRETEPTGASEPVASQTSKALTLTEEELERRIQSETDRREAKRTTETRERQRRELRDKDPFAYVEQERQDEQRGAAQGDLQQFLAGVGSHHDRVSLDPLVESLPPAERERIFKLEGAGVGLDGRKLVVTESLKALEKHWKAEGVKEAEAKLRRNPSFRKQVLSEARGTTVEPELLPAGGQSSADRSVSALLRHYYDMPSPQEHNSAG